MVISVLSSLDDLMLKEVAFITMNGLLGAVVPTSVDPFLAFAILPGTVYLGDDGLGQVVWILDMDPVA